MELYTYPFLTVPLANLGHHLYPTCPKQGNVLLLTSTFSNQFPYRSQEANLAWDNFIYSVKKNSSEWSFRGKTICHLLPMYNWMCVWLKSDTFFFVVKKDLNNPNLFIKTNRIHSYLISQQLAPLPPEAPNNTWCSWVLWVKEPSVPMQCVWSLQ